MAKKIEDKDPAPGGFGVRAQIVTAEGAQADDIVIVEAPHAIHVLNAPSPSATASIAIARHIASQATRSFNLGEF